MANFSEMFDDFVNKGMKDLNQTIKTVVSKVDGIKSESVAVNIIETGVSYRIEVVAPGFAKENFKLGIDNGVISIKGEREHFIRQPRLLPVLPADRQQLGELRARRCVA